MRRRDARQLGPPTLAPPPLAPPPRSEGQRSFRVGATGPHSRCSQATRGGPTTGNIGSAGARRHKTRVPATEGPYASTNDGAVPLLLAVTFAPAHAHNIVCRANANARIATSVTVPAGSELVYLPGQGAAPGSRTVPRTPPRRPHRPRLPASLRPLHGCRTNRARHATSPPLSHAQPVPTIASLRSVASGRPPSHSIDTKCQPAGSVTNTS